MNSNEDKLYIKIEALKAIYDFVVEKFFELKLFRVPKYYCMFIDFKISNLKLNFETLNDFK